ncbi:MAG: hypothetical protein HZB61_05165 [Nitrospirae bacterium]|nr:hypothetical protein [Nitrospirota bacterium]
MKTEGMFILLVLLISACASTPYTHSTKGAKDLEREIYECEKIAMFKAEEAGSPDNPFMIAAEKDRCLQVKFGWTPVK